MSKEVNLICFGDFLFEDTFVFSNKKDGFIKLFNEYGIVTFNLETTISNLEGTPSAKAFNFKSPSKNFETFVKDFHSEIVCHIGNNHIMDYGVDCLYDTISNLEKNNISYTGFSRDLSIEEGITYKQINTYVIAFIGGYNSFNVSATTPGLTAINKDLINKVKFAKKKSNYVVVHLHWGEELSLCQTPKQVTIAHGLVDAGANLIIGHHPHVIQEVESYKNAIIAYSLGNFQMMTYDYNDNSNIGLMLSITFNENDVKYEKIPIYLKDRIPEVIKDENSLTYQRYLEIEAQNKFFTKNNNWFLFFIHASKPFLTDSYKAWVRRIKKKENKIFSKIIKWHLSKKVIVMFFFKMVNFLIEKPMLNRIKKKNYS